MRNIRHAAVACGVILSASLLTASPALAAPPAPAGCTFDQGMLTCVTKTSSTATEGPFSTDGYVRALTLTDGFSGYQICAARYNHGYPTLSFYKVTGGFFTVRTDTTTTTTQRGVSGKSPVLSSSSTQSRTWLLFTADSTLCVTSRPS